MRYAYFLFCFCSCYAYQMTVNVAENTHTHRKRCILNVCVCLTDKLSFLLFLLITCLQRLFVLPVAYFQFGCVCVCVCTCTHFTSPHAKQVGKQTDKQINKLMAHSADQLARRIPNSLCLCRFVSCCSFVCN